MLLDRRMGSSQQYSECRLQKNLLYRHTVSHYPVQNSPHLGHSCGSPVGKYLQKVEVCYSMNNSNAMSYGFFFSFTHGILWHSEELKLRVGSVMAV